jgi:hypothetical protein
MIDGVPDSYTHRSDSLVLYLVAQIVNSGVQASCRRRDREQAKLSYVKASRQLVRVRTSYKSFSVLRILLRM